MTDHRAKDGSPAIHDGRQGDHFDDEINVSSVVYSSLGLLGATILGMLITLWMWRAFDARSEAATPPASPIAEANERSLPSGPRLQAHPEEELVEMRREQAERLHGYGWVDESQEIVHIPIAKAMDLVLAEGFDSVSMEVTEQEDPSIASEENPVPVHEAGGSETP